MASFDEMVADFTPMIHHVMKSLHIYKDEDEFFQVGQIALWEASQKFTENKGKFSNYAYTYMKGRMMNALKRANETKERNVYPDEPFWEAQAGGQSDTPFELDALLSYAGDLSAREKTWLVCTFYYCMTITDIAAQENVSPSAVKKWRKRAIEKLKSSGRGLLMD
ncbi:sigma-70 family RNA polymerase sigma factor [Bacillus aerolatus]|uniref:Sigma-70 family RNA polymerase sigma factor n=1 Tax=Bacillus aerolatus TaxID=2653354 RepID=A0A6I1FWK0_9BACI|nr:sigma-70 family RNA polymerase sigma factor [Bacillus aerolatus]KAB7707413.1 sigma-70 family RNA polymerase sigma factor [Bacillus aerolatus]